MIVCGIAAAAMLAPIVLIQEEWGRALMLWGLARVWDFASHWPLLFSFLVLMLFAHGAALYTCAKANDPVVTREMGELMGWFPKS